MKLVDIQKVTFFYENGTRVSLEGDQAKQLTQAFFATVKQFKTYNWKIENEKPIKGLFHKIISFFSYE